jgi:hypothetical protein
MISNTARSRIHGFLVGLCLLGISTPATTQPAAGTLTGIVTGVDGKPKSFAQVQLQGTAVYAAVTDVTGTFNVKSFTTGGSYRITIRQSDKTETQTQSITSLTLSIVVHW